MRRSLLLLLFMMGCDGATNEVYGLVGCIPFVGPLLVPDAGVGTGSALDAGPVDASGFFEDAGIPIIPQDARCTPSAGCDGGVCQGPCETGSVCVPVTSSLAYCLRPCSEPCTGDGVACESIGGADYCVPVTTRGSACERRACPASEGLGCLPARAEGNAILAYTCQKPCDPDAMNACGDGESCLPNAAGAIELQGGMPVACAPSQCPGEPAGEDGGSCPCTAGFGCVTTEQGALCARVQHVCGHPVGITAGSGIDGGARCDPGEAQAFCAPPGTANDADGGALPVWCAQGGSPARNVAVGTVSELLPGISGVCLGICRDPVSGTTHACPSGMACRDDLGLLFQVIDEDTACTTSAQCDVGNHAQCVGPLPAYAFENRCAVPYGICD